jgi:hypothetical protein
MFMCMYASNGLNSIAYSMMNWRWGSLENCGMGEIN